MSANKDLSSRRVSATQKLLELRLRGLQTRFAFAKVRCIYFHTEEIRTLITEQKYEPVHYKLSSNVKLTGDDVFIASLRSKSSTFPFLYT